MTYSDVQKKKIYKDYIISTMKTANDKYQTILTENGIAPNPHNYAEIPLKDRMKGKHLFCPFCLYTFVFEKFLIVDVITVKCPNCKNNMRIETLEKLTRMTISDFALWVFNYRLSGFWQKVKYKEWFYKLKLLGLYDEFMENYKRLKGENQNE